jgi:4-hydroxy-3-polyprenylbenzoate decarboxylase
VSEAAGKVIQHELGLSVDLGDGPSVIRTLLGEEAPEVQIHPSHDFEVSIASGSYRHDGMVICPCSGGTLGRLASGASTNLIERAADVCLKERRKLILVPRETPVSEIALENMLRLSRAGALILPASPGFYGGENTIDRLIDFVVARILDHLGAPHALGRPYGQPARRHLESE